MFAKDLRREPAVLHHVSDAVDNALAIADDNVGVASDQRHRNLTK